MDWKTIATSHICDASSSTEGITYLLTQHQLSCMVYTTTATHIHYLITLIHCHWSLQCLYGFCRYVCV